MSSTLFRCISFCACFVFITTNVRAATLAPFDIDSSFGQNGISSAVNVDGNTDTATVLAADRRGHTYGFVGNANFRNILGTVAPEAIARWITASGELDTSFGSAGILGVPESAPTFPQSLCVDPKSGDILIAGLQLINTTPMGALQMVVTRFNGLGQPISLWGTGGVATILTSGISAAYACEVEADGSVYIAGGNTTDVSLNNSQAIVIKLKADGTLDSSFGIAGIAGMPISEGSICSVARGVTRARDGHVYVLGSAWTCSVTGPIYKAAVGRLNSDGTVDSGFNKGNMIFVTLGSPTDFASAIRFQANGKLLVVGGGNYGGTTPFGAFFRLNSDGTLAPFPDGNQVIAQDIPSPSGVVNYGGNFLLTRKGKIQVGIASNNDAAIMQMVGFWASR